jgi:hypothetical protein
MSAAPKAGAAEIKYIIYKYAGVAGIVELAAVLSIGGKRKVYALIELPDLLSIVDQAKCLAR